jgi:hypothetical protein
VSREGARREIGWVARGYGGGVHGAARPARAAAKSFDVCTPSRHESIDLPTTTNCSANAAYLAHPHTHRFSRAHRSGGEL